MLIENIKSDLKNYKFYDNCNYKENINFLLECLDNYKLIKNVEFKDNEITINIYDNNNYFNLYVVDMDNYISNFFMSVIFNKIVIYKDIQTIKINDFILNMDLFLFSSFYEYY